MGDLSVRQAMSDLNSWLARVDSRLVDDLEKLPYVCAAMEQLEQRKKYWNEHRASDSNKASINTICKVESHGLMSNASKANEIKKLQECLGGSRDAKDNDSYNFYQAVDGKHIILHPLNVKCLLHHYGSYDSFPHRISGRILEIETVTQLEAVRKRYQYLSHFSLTTTYQLCEIDLSGVLPPDALLPFMAEIKKREKQRKQLARKSLFFWNMMVVFWNENMGQWVDYWLNNGAECKEPQTWKV
ncbi:hypothetical protein CRYUN_Cryun33cG0065900 [Craigia yunnanensis]